MTRRALPRMHGRTYYRMADVIPEGRIETADRHGRTVTAIEHFTVGQNDNWRAAFHPDEYVTPGDYCRLRINGTMIMSDTDHEQRTNRYAVMDARGDMLMAGLGIGLTVLPIIEKVNVTSLLVVEKSLAVIRLVGEHLTGWPGYSAQTGLRYAQKLTILHGDIHTWRPEKKGRQFDAIYFDIWGDQSTDEIPVMQQLHRQFRPYVRKGGWVTSWNYEGLRDRQRG